MTQIMDKPPDESPESLAHEAALVDEMIAEESEISDGITEETLDEIVNEVFAEQDSATAFMKITIPDAAAEQLKAFAANYDVPLKTYLEAVLHYVISTERRPGSWEGSQPFEFRTYDTRREGGSVADRWF